MGDMTLLSVIYSNLVQPLWQTIVEPVFNLSQTHHYLYQRQLFYNRSCDNIAVVKHYRKRIKFYYGKTA